jgi:hypothetical protein
LPLAFLYLLLLGAALAWALSRICHAALTVTVNGSDGSSRLHAIRSGRRSRWRTLGRDSGLRLVGLKPAFRKHPELGLGAAHRLVRETQRRYFDPQPDRGP